MMNVGENRAQNGVRMLPESRNEVENQIVETADVGRYAPAQPSGKGDARGWLCRQKNSFLRSERVETCRTSPFSSLITFRRNFQPSNLSKLHFKDFCGISWDFACRLNSIMELKVLILELYLVNPCVAEQKTLIVLLVDTPFAGRIASPLV
ncbi:hypothetical protein E3N88_09992 [Mikania micrantha]|uniref:Uncharacterized protein n=1 Tax=Mikania micrantha TaxID=192012 RepID=A0A5N6P979_9ASTR|nr:hypothetical protein E3N88_09992 [Mikania micrantha]